MKISVKQMLLMDGLGALFSVFLLAFVLVQLETYIGLPRQILYILSFMPCIYAVYSIGCYLFLTHNLSFYLKIVATANVLYCCITLGLLIANHQSMTVLGWLYFLIETVIILGLAFFEFKIARENVL
jgi:hypothetical protein